MMSDGAVVGLTCDGNRYHIQEWLLQGSWLDARARFFDDHHGHTRRIYLLPTQFYVMYLLSDTGFLL